MIKKLAFFFFFILSLIEVNYAINASVDFSVHYNQDQPYIEVYSRYFGNSILFKQDSLDSEFHAELELTIIIKDSTKIIEAAKYNIKSPKSSSKKDFWDRKKYSLDPGNYMMELRVRNVLYDDDPTFKYETSISIVANDSPIFLSDPTLISSYSHEADSKYPFQWHGFHFEPLSYNLVLEEQETLLFLQEVYNHNASYKQDYYISYSIAKGTPSENNEALLTGYKRINDSEFHAYLLDINLKELLSGTYTLIIEARDRNKVLFDEKKKVFSIHHPLADLKYEASFNSDFEYSFVQLMNERELNYALKAIYPQTENINSELLNYVIQSDDLTSKKFYLFNYYAQLAPQDPGLIYNKYMEVAKAVDHKYASQLGHGFETDRGYIFLKYGRPNNIISIEDEPSAPPYEIWIYEFLEKTNESNVKFLFYNPSLGHNDFELLHSTCRLERRNPRWELELYRDALSEQPSNPIDNTRMLKNWNRQARTYFEDF